MTDISDYTMHIGLRYNYHFRIKVLMRFSSLELLIIISLLLLNSEDIELNPGPLSECPTTSVSTDISVDESLIRNKFPPVHYNVQSLVNNTDILQSELSNFDIISITETWLDHRTSDDDISLQCVSAICIDVESNHLLFGICHERC